MAHNDPLAGWKKKNLAAPRRPEHQHNIQESIYDDTPVYVPPPTPAPQALPRQEFPNPPSNQYLQPPVIAPPEQVGVERRILTNEERNKCPHGDTRWPPPNESYSKPLQLRYKEKGERKKFYYNLLYQNTAPEVSKWVKDVSRTAKSIYKAKFPDEPAIIEEGKSKEEIKAAKKEAKEAKEAKVATARSAFMAAKMQQRSLRELSRGPRGTLWILDEGSEHVWRCIEIAQKASPHKAMTTGPGCQERFELFGVGLKGNKWDMLLISEKVSVE